MKWFIYVSEESKMRAASGKSWSGDFDTINNLFSCCVVGLCSLNFLEKPCPTNMGVSFVVINILVTMLKKKHNFNNILHITPYVQNISILICNLCKVINEIFFFSYHVLKILYILSLKHISFGTNHVSRTLLGTHDWRLL